VPGFLPFVPPAGFQLIPDDAPILVTSFAEFSRTFGAPPADPSFTGNPGYGFLSYAARAFFDNGGKRAYIARAVRPDATAAFHQIDMGAVSRLVRNARATDSTIFVNSLRGIVVAGTASHVNFVLPDGHGVLPGSGLAVTGYDTQAGSITFGAPIGIDVDATKVAVISDSVHTTPALGPMFFARNPGRWGANLKIYVSSSDRSAVRITTGLGGQRQLQVASTGSFYIGALILIDNGAGDRYERVVSDILPGNTLVLDPGGLALPAIPGTLGPNAFAQVAEIDVLVADSATGAFETHKRLSWNGDPDPAIRVRHYSTVINNRSSLVYVQPPWAGLGGNTEMPPTSDNQPISRGGSADGPQPGTAETGDDGTPILPPATRAHIVGVDNGPGQRSGIQALQDIDDARVIAAPGETDQSVQNELIAQAERLRYRFVVLDCEAAPGPANVVNEILKHRNAYDTSYAAYYTPWVQIGAGDQTLFLPPSGHVIGIYARTDNDRGVWKAPANEVVRGITGMQAYITAGEQDILNPRGVNALRRFEGRGIRVWGARTLSSDPEFRYINVRRFLIYMEASIDRGTQWVVFEPNAPDTWSRVVDSVSAFLSTQWRNGALFGRKPEDAYFVRCDETTMTVDDIQNGRLICDIGVAIVRPAEFVIFRIEQITGFGTKS
jgi:hypothetical protein